MKVSKLTSQKGITLVALIITIIVLLILAMVSIRLVMNGGIIDKANKGVNAYNEAEVKEKIQLAYSELEMAKFTNSNLDETQFLKERLEAQGLTGATVEATSDGWNITYNGKSYPLSKNGTVGDAVAVIDWDKVIANAQKHPDQSDTIPEIGIDMYGNPVNLDLWNYELDETNKTIKLGKQVGSREWNIVSYIGEVLNGKIVGEIPKYIKKNNEIFELISLQNAFRDSEIVISPEIPNSVTDMSNTFSGCKSLTTAPTIPNSVTNMAATFSDCTSLTTAPTIPNSVTYMGSTFSGCKSLTTAPTIGNSVTNMRYAFSGCKSLTTVPTIGNSVTDMSSTFENCTALTNVPTIPNSVTNMDSTFENCSSLITAPVIGNSVTNMYETFLDCTSLTTVVNIGNSVTSMERAFRRCTSLTTAPTIPNSVTNMSCTFLECTSLTTAPIIPNSVTSMESTFRSCTSLTTAPTIPSSVTNIEATFWECKSLTGTLVINANTVSILNGCLLNAATNDGCNLVVSGTCPQLDSIIATKSSKSHITKGQ